MKRKRTENKINQNKTTEKQKENKMKLNETKRKPK